MRYLALIFALVLPFSATAAENPSFAFPLACTYGTNCWVMNYTDTGPENDGTATDPSCFSRTYNGHKGTDFALPDGAAMKRGVDVLAAADGTVLRIRDGEEDRWPTQADLDATKKAQKECGNAVLIDHGNGWQTMSCHMKKGSIAVKPGQAVKTGERLGQVGLSGFTEFPHLHFGITHNGTVIDPFTGRPSSDLCDASANAPLWKAGLSLPYEEIRIAQTGFAFNPPKLEDLDKEMSHRAALRKDAPALIFYAVILGARDQDRILLTIRDANGEIYTENTIMQDRNRARQMFFIGRKIPAGIPLEIGKYTGTVKIERIEKNGKSQIFSQEKELTVQ